MKELNDSNFIQINKIVLTSETIRCLESLQAHNNFGLHAIRDDLAHAVCLLGQCVSMIDEDLQEDVLKSVTALAQARKTLKELAKPSSRISINE